MDKELSAFFEPLVGSEAAIQNFQAILSEGIAPYAAGDDAFAQLQSAGNEIVNALVLGANNLKPGEDDSDLTIEWRSMRVNGKIGINSTLAPLKTLSKIYQKHEKRTAAAQDPDLVWKNTDRAIRHVYQNAFHPAIEGVFNELVMRTALNPARSWNKPFIIASALWGGTAMSIVSRRAFLVESDADGQLDIRPRYPHTSFTESDNRCPATNIHIEVEGESPSALLTFMRCIGTVAVQDIFPHRFSIVSSEQK